jgi:hypothetical protein
MIAMATIAAAEIAAAINRHCYQEVTGHRLCC